jgi:hypothetical protein
VIGIELIERRGWGVRQEELTPRDQTVDNHRRREDVLT